LPASWDAISGAFPPLVKAISTQKAATPAPATRSQSQREAILPSGDPAAAAPTGPRVEIRYRRKKRHRRRSRESKKAILWQAVAGCVMVVVLLLLAIAFFKKTTPKLIRSPTLPENIEQNPNP
jgi:hypothetical protein